VLARDVMTTRVVTVLEDTPVEEIAQTLLKRRISAVPVIDTDDRLVGIVSEGDLIGRPEPGGQRDDSWWLSGILDPEKRARTYAKARGQLAKDVMTTSVITATEDESLVALAAMLEEGGIKRVPIVRGGRVVGIVSRANLLHGLAALPETDAVAEGSTERVVAQPSRPPTPDARAIRASILNKVHNEIGVRGSINVIVSDGTVDLWGGVETEAERQAVRAAAENTPNVTAVKDHISVLSPALRHLLGADRAD